MWQRDYFFKIISLEPDPFSELTRLLLKLKTNEDACSVAKRSLKQSTEMLILS